MNYYDAMNLIIILFLMIAIFFQGQTIKLLQKRLDIHSIAMGKLVLKDMGHEGVKKMIDHLLGEEPTHPTKNETPN